MIQLDPNSKYLVFETEAYMYFPNDKVQFDQYILERQSAMQIDDLGTETTVRMSALEISKLKDLPSPSQYASNLDTLIKKGVIAGDILMSIYLDKIFGITSEPSLNKAVFFLKDFYLGQRYRNGKAWPTSPSTIRKAWNQFRLSAPIHAAIRLNRVYPFCELKNELGSAKNLDLTLRVAAAVFKFGSFSIPQHGSNSTPLLDPKISIFSDYYLSNSLTLSGSVLEPDVLVDALRKYEAPI